MFSQLLKTGKLLFTFLTMVTNWSRSMANFCAPIGQNLTGEFMHLETCLLISQTDRVLWAIFKTGNGESETGNGERAIFKTGNL